MHARVAGDVEDHYVYLSTPVAEPFEVTVVDGLGNPLAGSPFTISNGNAQAVFVGDGQLSGSELMVPAEELNGVIVGRGLVLTAEQPFYANARYRDFYQAEYLTCKGRKALGTTFRFGAAPIPEQHDRRSFVLGLMATEDGTVVNISDYDPLVVFNGLPNVTSNNLNVALNAGECYVVSGYANNMGNLAGMVGALIESNAPIVVNVGNWMGSIAFNPGQDMLLDQIVPVEYTGQSFVLVEGNGLSEQERGLVIAHTDGTEVFMNGSSNPDATLNAGEWWLVPNAFYSGSGHRNLHIATSQPAYVYQFLAGSPSLATPGMNFIPPLTCGMPHEVNEIPDINHIGAQTYEGGIFIVTEAGANVLVNGTPATGAEAVAGAPEWETYKIEGLTGDVQVVSTGSAVVGAFGQNEDEGFAGYFSGFTADVEADFEAAAEACWGDDVPVVFTGQTTDSTVMSWDFGELPVSPLADGEWLLTPDAAGTFTLSLVLDELGCLDSSVHTLVVHPQAVASEALVGCDELTWNGLTVGASGTFDWVGQTVHGCDSSVQLTATIHASSFVELDSASCTPITWMGQTLQTTGLYEHLLVNTAQCDSLTTLSFTLLETPAPTAEVPELVCNGAPVAVAYLEGNPLASGTAAWSVDGIPAGTGAVADLPAAVEGTHAVALSVSTANGCSAADTAVYSVLPPLTLSLAPVSECVPYVAWLEVDASPDSDPGLWSLTNAQWALDGAQVDPGGALTIAVPGVHEVGVHQWWTWNAANEPVCAVQGFTTFEGLAVPNIGWTSDPVQWNAMHFTGTFQALLDGSPATEGAWTWHIEGGALDTGPELPWSFPALDGPASEQVCLTYHPASGCEATHCADLNWESTLLVSVPNAFTPNNDGHNDAWGPVLSAPELVEDYRLLVFDRWGEVVFEATDSGASWIGENSFASGTHFVPSGAYSWVLELTPAGGTPERYRGSVVVVR